MTNPLKLLQLLKILDLTRLTDTDSGSDIAAWLNTIPELPTPVAALCVYPTFLPQTQAYINLHLPGADLATVVNFPSGTEPLSDVLNDISHAIAAGATEIDCVLPYQQLMTGDEQGVAQFLNAVRQATPNICLKIIIESGELLTAQQVTKASELVIASGADFVKTSTGKVPVGCTLEAARIILTSIAAANRPVGFKASGGVKSVEQALQLLSMYEEITGKTAAKQGMRIGASSLLTDVVALLPR
jgi:deoxyribose-phosphate aldolase